jgi:hypothetical protein
VWAHKLQTDQDSYDDSEPNPCPCCHSLGRLAPVSPGSVCLRRLWRAYWPAARPIATNIGTTTLVTTAGSCPYGGVLKLFGS